MFPIIAPGMAPAGAMPMQLTPAVLATMQQAMQQLEPAMQFQNMAMGGMLGGMVGAGMDGPASATGAPDGGNPFWKTRICHKWRDGACPMRTEDCKYAHGDGDLQRQHSGRQYDQGHHAGARVMTAHGNGGFGSNGSFDRTKAHKTRLCERFMNAGSCPYNERCTFAHGEHELRSHNLGPRSNFSNGGAGTTNGTYKPHVPASQPVANANAPPAKRPAEFVAPAAAPDAYKRPRVTPVVPPAQEVLPGERSLTSEVLREKFEHLKHEVARFASETGHSVAVFTVGGILSSSEDTPADDYGGDVYTKAVTGRDQLKLNIFKYGTGGVCGQLVKRPEIVKFVCARGTKALQEMTKDNGESAPGTYA